MWNHMWTIISLITVLVFIVTIVWTIVVLVSSSSKQNKKAHTTTTIIPVNRKIITTITPPPKDHGDIVPIIAKKLCFVLPSNEIWNIDVRAGALIPTKDAPSSLKWTIQKSSFPLPDVFDIEILDQNDRSLGYLGFVSIEINGKQIVTAQIVSKEKLRLPWRLHYNSANKVQLIQQQAVNSQNILYMGLQMDELPFTIGGFTAAKNTIITELTIAM